LENKLQSVVLYGTANFSDVMRAFNSTSPRPTILRAKHLPGNRKAPKKRDLEAPVVKGPPVKKGTSSRWRIDFVGTKPDLHGMEV
jgi:hypothetical protein